MESIIPELHYWLSWPASALAGAALLVYLLESLLEEGQLLVFCSKSLKPFLKIAMIILLCLSWWAAAYQQKESEPRILTKEQRSTLISKLSPHANNSPTVTIYEIRSDIEAWEYSMQWAQVLKESNWKVREAGVYINGEGLIIGIPRNDAHISQFSSAKILQYAIISSVGVIPKIIIDEHLPSDGHISLYVARKE